jgi:hypothetical protein
MAVTTADWAPLIEPTVIVLQTPLVYSRQLKALSPVNIIMRISLATFM